MLDPRDAARRTEKVRRSWARQAPRYDRSMGFWERRVFGVSHRAWACARAWGATLEVAVGTGLNLPHYAPDVTLTGIDISPEMLDLARARADELGRDVDLRTADAHSLPFPDATFDTVVCTYGLCGIPDPARAIAEMGRVLRAGGRLILVDHIRSAVAPVLWIQKAVEVFTSRLEGEYMTRRPLEHVRAAGFEVSERDRLGLASVVERLVALKR